MAHHLVQSDRDDPSLQLPRSKCALARRAAQARQNAPGRRLLRIGQRLVPILLVIGLGVLLALDVTILNAFLIALSFVWEIVFGILITIVQFVAIFWFMSRSRVERIRTMTVSTSRRSSDRGDGT